MSTSNQCISCANYRGAFTCTAYPERIPQQIVSGEHDHEKPFKGDGGVRFKPLTKDKTE
jgi:hypothetical protein